MSAEFDPYFKLLGIPPEEQPPHHYRLLGMSKPFEDDLEVIDTCCNRVTASLRKLQSGPRAEVVNKLLNEVATARLMLLNPVKKRAYDDWLRSKIKAAEEAVRELEARQKKRLLIGIGVAAVLVIGLGIGGWIVFSKGQKPTENSNDAIVKTTQPVNEAEKPVEPASQEMTQDPPATPAANSDATAAAAKPAVATPATTASIVVRYRPQTFDAAEWQHPVLPRLDPELDGSPEGWSKASDGTLVSSAAPAALSLPFNPPGDEYAVEFDLEPRDANTGGMWIILPTKDRPVVFGIGVGSPPRTGILVDGFSLEQQPLLSPSEVTIGPAGQTTRVTVGVLQNGAYVGFNNAQVFGWRGDLRRLSSKLPQDLPGRPDRILLHTIGGYLLKQVAGKDSPGTPFTAPEEIYVSKSLLEVLDVERDAQRGQWYWTDTQPVHLLAPTQPGSRLQLPIQPPEQYDFEISAILPANGAMVVGLPWEKRTLHVVLSSGKIDLRGFAPAELPANAWPPDTPKRLIFQCRKELIDISSPDSFRVQARLDPKAEVIADEFTLPWLTPAEKLRPFLGTTTTSYSVGKIAVRPVPEVDKLTASSDAIALKPLSGLEKPAPTAVMPEKPAETAAPEPQAPVATTKIPIPSEADQKAAAEDLMTRHKSQIDQASKPIDFIRISQEFRSRALKDSSNPGVQYALLQKSREMAINAGDPNLALAICDEIHELFEVDAPKLKLETMTSLVKTTKVLGKIRSLLEAVVRELWLASDLGREDLFAELSDLGTTLAARAKDKTTVEAMRLFKKEVPSESYTFGPLCDYKDLQNSRAKLQRDPSDAAAHLAVGGYMCLREGDWSHGLVHLAKGADKELSEIAKLDLASPATHEQQLNLATRWLALSQTTSSRYARFAERGGYWIAQAVKQMPPDQVSQVKPQLKQIFRASLRHAPSLTLLERLAPIRRNVLYSKVQIEGEPSTSNYEILPGEPSLLVGFDVEFKRLKPEEQISRRDGIQFLHEFGICNAVFMNNAGIEESYAVSDPAAGVERVSIRARRGWAVAGLRDNDYTKLQGFAVLFRKITENGLDRDRAYWSESFFGSQMLVPIGRNAAAIDTLNLPVIGFFGQVKNPPVVPPAYQKIEHFGFQVVNKDALGR